jgi:hypothetical protein
MSAQSRRGNRAKDQMRERDKKIEIAKDKALKKLLEPTDVPPPEWMNNPGLLPKRPPRKLAQ